MSLVLFAYAYAAVALIVGGHVYFREVLTRGAPKEFALEDRVVLSIAAAGVGVLWVLFFPALLALWTIQVVHFVESHRPRHIFGWPRALRARS